MQKNNNFLNLERLAAEEISVTTNSKLKYPSGQEAVDVCAAIEEMRDTMQINWTAEEKDLRRMKQVIENGRHMDRLQLGEYCKKLATRQSDMASGRLGSVFFAQLGRIKAQAGDIGWQDLKKDVEHIQELLSAHPQWNQEIWRKFLPRLQAHQETYFKTELGREFVRVLEQKAGTGKTAQKSQCLHEVALQREKEELEQVAAWLMSDADDGKDVQRKTTRLISGWFGNKAEKLAVPILAGLFVCFMGVWLCGEAGRRQSEWQARLMRAETGQAQAEEKDRAKNISQADGQTRAGKYYLLTAAQEGKAKKAQINRGQGAQAEADFAGAATLTKTKVSGGQSQRKQALPPDILPQYAQMAEEYPQLFGWLKIPDTEIDLPVMRPADDREFYLHHDFTGAPSAEGALFADGDSRSYPRDDNIVIYGHNMKNGHMFGALKQYLDKVFFDAHREVLFDSVYETGRYEVVAVLKTRILNENEDGFRYYQFYNYTDKKGLRELCQFVEGNQVYETGVTLRKKDRILMLSTCEYSQENGRLVIVARLKQG